MAVRRIRARVHAGRLEPLEHLPLAEGTEVMVTVDLPADQAVPNVRPRRLSVWNLGAPRTLTRGDFYDDAG